MQGTERGWPAKQNAAQIKSRQLLNHTSKKHANKLTSSQDACG